MPFAGTSPVLIVPSNRIGLLFTSTIPLVLLGVSLYHSIKLSRHQAKSRRRRAQASEMKVLKERLDRFQAKIDGGEVISEEEMEEVKRMERLFGRWVRALEDDAAADDGGRSAAVRAGSGWF